MLNTFLAIFSGIAACAVLFMAKIISDTRRDLRDAKNSTDTDNQRADRYEQSVKMLLDETRRQYESQIAALEQRLENRDRELSEHSALAFSALADEALRKQSQRLADDNNSRINEILRPLKDNLADFSRAVNDSYVKENSSREALSRQIDTLAKANAEIGKEARHLSNALKGNAVMQGKWGETVLERILENAGLIKEVHYFAQKGSDSGSAITDEEGRNQRPDMMVIIPGDQRLIIDAKTSMKSFFEFADADTTQEADDALKRHVAATRRHVAQLAAKAYHKNIRNSIEHVLMFMPNDASYLAAVRGDKDILEYAMKQNIVIVSPATVISVIQLISQLWRIERQNANTEKIAALGGLLYDKFVAFINDFRTIEKHIDASRSAYDKCFRHLGEGGTSLIKRAERLREMGAKTTRQIPDELKDEN